MSKGTYHHQCLGSDRGSSVMLISIARRVKVTAATVIARARAGYSVAIRRREIEGNRSAVSGDGRKTGEQGWKIWQTIAHVAMRPGSTLPRRAF
jgi:hypothetical protein